MARSESPNGSRRSVFRQPGAAGGKRNALAAIVAAAAITLSVCSVASANQAPQATVAHVAAVAATSNNVAGNATPTASSQNSQSGQTAAKSVDGIVGGYPGDSTKEWATQGGKAGSWLRLTWATPVTINEVVLYDRPNSDDRVTAGRLTFADGTFVNVPALNNAGTAQTVTFSSRSTRSVRFSVSSVSTGTANIGLSEFEVWTSPTSSTTPTTTTAPVTSISPTPPVSSSSVP